MGDPTGNRPGTDRGDGGSDHKTTEAVMITKAAVKTNHLVLEEHGGVWNAQ